MAGLNLEINSFVSKLMQMNSLGLNACLNLQAYHGRVYVNLQADLGHDNNYNYCQTRTNERNHSSSRQRRRLRRRRKAFKKASNGHEATEKDVTRSESDSYKTELEVQERRSVESSVNSSEPRSFTGNSAEQDMDASLLEQSAHKKIESAATPPSPIRPSTDDDENEESTWTWTPPSEEDILHYMREHNITLRQSSEFQEEVGVSNTPMAGGVFNAGDMFYNRFSMNMHNEN